MTGAEIALLEQMGKIPIQHFTITGAEDWPMFLAMIKVLGVVVASAWGSIIGLVIYIWSDLKKTISSNRSEDNKTCEDCKKSIWDHISGPIWTAIETCCPRWSEVDKIKLRDDILKNAGA